MCFVTLKKALHSLKESYKFRSNLCKNQMFPIKFVVHHAVINVNYDSFLCFVCPNTFCKLFRFEVGWTRGLISWFLGWNFQHSDKSSTFSQFPWYQKNIQTPREFSFLFHPDELFLSFSNPIKNLLLKLRFKSICTLYTVKRIDHIHTQTSQASHWNCTHFLNNFCWILSVIFFDDISCTFRFCSSALLFGWFWILVSRGVRIFFSGRKLILLLSFFVNWIKVSETQVSVASNLPVLPSLSALNSANFWLSFGNLWLLAY